MNCFKVQLRIFCIRIKIKLNGHTVETENVLRCIVIKILLKGIVHSKTSYSKPVSLFLVLKTKADILKNVVTKQLLVPIDFHSIENTIKVSGDQKVFVYPTIFKMSSFVFNTRNKFSFGFQVAVYKKILQT